MKDTDEPRQLEPLVTEPRMAEDAIEPNVTEPTPETCRNCKFWWVLDPDWGRNECRIEPPIRRGYDESGCDPDHGVWPSTIDNDWCGKFQVRPKDTKQV